MRAAVRGALAALLIALIPATGFGQRIVLVDRIVAIVNKEVVTHSELRDALQRTERDLRRRNIPLPDREVLERQVLERLILDRAQLQFARETGIRVDELQLDRTVQRIAESNNMTLSEFRRTLERDGVSFNAFREDVREQIVFQRLREREVDDKVQVSETEIDLFLEENRKSGREGVEYFVAHILVAVPDGASPQRVEQSRARAEQARAEARSGADFAKIVASYSDAPDALKGGLLGWRAADRLPELFGSAVARMNPGDVSEVLRSGAGFHVLKLLERRGLVLSGDPVVQTRARHILVRTNEAVSEAEARRRLADLRERIVRGGADFAELARANSDDGTAARGGDLEWLYPGDVVPEFERAMNALKPGDISQPVQTPFGWHLIQVLERRKADVTEERRRLQARQVLKERKADEAYQEWLRQLRDATYVELRVEER
jgi:peptidyl-prolyl cis-trans isomerase SurA